jgi:hypothetical protein
VSPVAPPTQGWAPPAARQHVPIRTAPAVSTSDRADLSRFIQEPAVSPFKLGTQLPGDDLDLCGSGAGRDGFGPILGSILLRAGTTTALGQGVLLLPANALRLGLPFLLAALFMQGLAGHLRRLKRYVGIINLGAGALLVLMGVLVYAGTFLRLATLFRPAI